MMTAQVSIGTHLGDVFRRFIGGTMEGDAVGHDHDHQDTIHSGHFMVSCVHEDFDDAAVQERDDDDEGEDGDEGKGRTDELVYGVEDANGTASDGGQLLLSEGKCTSQLSIDASLAKLFNHMTLAYSGKITSPKWKNFNGIKVKLKDKIRLNNIIWREWHMQYIKRQKPVVCQFEAPISERTHSKPEAVVLEGKYWKRRLQCLTTEYKTWRLYYKNHVSKVHKESQSMEEGDLQLLLGNYERLGNQFPPMRLFDEQMEDDYLLTFANDTLFSSLNPPFAFPDTRGISQYGFGNIIQPNLIQLQPSIDESMDTLGPLPILNESHDFGCSPIERNSSFKISDGGLIDILFGDASFPDESSRQETTRSKLDLQQPLTSKDDYLINQLQLQLMESSGLSPDGCLDLFTNNNNKLLTGESDVAMTSQDYSFFPSVDQLGILKEQTRRFSDQPMLPPRDFVTDSGEISSFPASLGTSLFQPSSSLLHGGNILQNVTLVPDATPSQCGAVLSLVPQMLWSPAASSSRSSVPSCASVNSLAGEPEQGNLAGPAVGQSCLQSDDRYKTCRRGSTGSLQPAKAKKHVTFVCPQPLSDASASKPKHRLFSPMQTTLSENITSKTPEGLAKGKASTIADHKPQGTTILAQLLTQGKTTSWPFLPSKSASGSNWNASNATVATNEIQPTINSRNSPFFSIGSSSPYTASKDHIIPTAQCQSSLQPSSSSSSSFYSEFHKSILLAAASQSLGVEAQDAHEVTTSLLNNMLSRATSSAPSAVPAVTNSSMVGVCTPISNESTESASDELSDNPREHRRVHHLSAEQKRRSNIKTGFETLNQLVPELSVMSSSKINKATTLQKAAECCRRLKSERQSKVCEIETLRRQIDELQTEICSCQAKLPATGVPVVRPQTNLSKVLFQDYIRNQTLANWKFWIFCFLIRPLFDLYDEGVVTTSSDSFCQSVLAWLQQHCSLVALRPAVLKALRELSTTTSVLVDPSNMPQEAANAVSNQSPSGK